MKLQGEFGMLGNGPVSEETRRAFEADGLTPPQRGGLGQRGGDPLGDMVVGWFFLEANAPGLSAAIATSVVQKVEYIVERMTKWLRSGESPRPEARKHIVVKLGGRDDPNGEEFVFELNPDSSPEEVEAVVRAAMTARQAPASGGQAQ